MGIDLPATKQGRSDLAKSWLAINLRNLLLCKIRQQIKFHQQIYN